jgi:HlyD family secretion protein
VVLGLLALVGAGVVVRQRLQQRAAAPAAAPAPPAPVEAVAALGRLDPAGEILLLAAPITGIGGSPRISRLLVQEGDRVQAGQLLASFDNRPGHRAEKQLLLTRIANLQRRLALERRELERFRSLASVGAVAPDALDVREQEFLVLQGELEEARAELVRVKTDLVNTELRAPIDGTVLRIHARVGERPDDDGILELADSDRMEALLEVYESDIDRVRPGQRVELRSENGGFEGTLAGRVKRISPQVRQREILSTDPTADADARIVEVRVGLDPEDARRVRELTGLKVIGRFLP